MLLSESLSQHYRPVELSARWGDGKHFDLSFDAIRACQAKIYYECDRDRKEEGKEIEEHI